MNLLIRAVITGFGLKLGAEAAKLLSSRLRKFASGREDEAGEPRDAEETEDDELPTTITPDRPLV